MNIIHHTADTVTAIAKRFGELTQKIEIAESRGRSTKTLKTQLNRVGARWDTVADAINEMGDLHPCYLEICHTGFLDGM